MVVKGGLPTTGFSVSKLRWTRPSSGLSCTLPFRRPRFSLLTVRVCLLMGALSAHGGTFCSICRGVDHRADYCALAYLNQPTSSLSTPPPDRLGGAQQWPRTAYVFHGTEESVRFLHHAHSGMFVQSVSSSIQQ